MIHPPLWTSPELKCLGCLELYQALIWYTGPKCHRQYQSLNVLVAKGTLLPWQQGHIIISLRNQWLLTKGNSVAIAMMEYHYDLVVWCAIKFIFSTGVPWDNINSIFVHTIGTFGI